MTEQAYIVQFPHPGPEHQPKGQEMPWNTGDHRRKFMVTPGRYRDEHGGQQGGKVVFWGEWEGPSRVVRKWPPNDPLPRFLHEPHFDTPRVVGFRQNTDPWVFGERFRYSNCKQRTNRGMTATAMQRLTTGSLILFGSTIGASFVLDTVLVVGERLGSFTPAHFDDLEVDEAFRVATLKSLSTGPPEEMNMTFTLFAGATPADPAEGMFSFVPCLPYDSDGPRFPRPTIELPGIVNPQSSRSTSGSTRRRPLGEVTSAWQAVVSQVIEQDLLLATYLELADRRVRSAPSDAISTAEEQ